MKKTQTLEYTRWTRDLWVNDKKEEVQVDFEELARKRTQPKIILENQVGLKNVFEGLQLRNKRGPFNDDAPVMMEEELKFTRMIGVLR